MKAWEALYICWALAVLAVIVWTEISSAKLWREHDKVNGICDECSMQGHCHLEERRRNFLNYIKELRYIRTGKC